MVMKKLYVFCYLSGQLEAVPAGIFEYDDRSQVGLFSYGSQYVDRAEALAVDPVALPLAGEPQPVTTNGGLYGSFRDASPDYWGRLVMASCLERPVESISEIDFLTHANATRVGNLDFRPSLESPEPELKPPAFQNLEGLMDAADGLERGDAVPKERRVMLEQGSSLGGARPKCTIELDGDLWLAKFSSKNDSTNVPCLEYGIMQLASLCGLRVPESRLEKLGERNVFLVRRFDRMFVDTGWARRGYLSALSLAQWDERDRERWSYRSIAERMRKYSAKPDRDLRELFSRIAFNILVRNTDDHPRNHGFLFEDNGLELSPLFDVVPALTYPGVGTEFYLAMSIGENGRLASLDNLCSAAPVYNLKTSESKELATHLQETVKSHWKDTLSNAGMSEADLQRLAPSIAGGESD